MRRMILIPPATSLYEIIVSLHATINPVLHGQAPSPAPFRGHVSIPRLTIWTLDITHC